MGDMHGDYYRAVTILKFSGIVDDDAHWAGGDTIFVQTVCIQ